MKDNIFAVVFTLSIISVFLFSSGYQLYEFLLILVIVLFFFIIRRKEMNFERKLALIILIFTIIQVWTAFYEIIPRVYTPGIKCDEYLTTPEGYGNFYASFGNYGNLPAWLMLDFQNKNNISIINTNKINVVLTPITYQNNEQTRFYFNFRVINNSENIGFKFRYIVFGDDIIDKFSASFKKSFNIYNEIECNYKMISNNSYSLISL